MLNNEFNIIAQLISELSINIFNVVSKRSEKVVYCFMKQLSKYRFESSYEGMMIQTISICVECAVLEKFSLKATPCTFTRFYILS